MKVRMLNSGDRPEFVEVTAEEAKRLIEEGRAEPVAEKRSEKAETR